MRDRAKADDLAQRMLVADSGWVPGPYPWLDRPPQLSNLWPAARDRYRRMAEEALRDR
jgi:hypothetical protein